MAVYSLNPRTRLNVVYVQTHFDLLLVLLLLFCDALLINASLLLHLFGLLRSHIEDVLLAHRVESLLLSLTSALLLYRLRESSSNLQNAVTALVLVVVELLHHSLEVHRILQSHASLLAYRIQRQQTVQNAENVVLEVQLVRRAPLLQSISLVLRVTISLQLHFSHQRGEHVLQSLLVDELLRVLRLLQPQQVVNRLRVTPLPRTHLERGGARVLVLADGDQQQVHQLLLAQKRQHGGGLLG